MLNWLKHSLGIGKNQPASLVDPDFGRISYEWSSDDGQTGFWQMHDDWELSDPFSEVSCSSIPGTPAGPLSEARQFLLAKRDALPAVWSLCAKSLQSVRADWKDLPQDIPLESCFKLTSLGLDEPITHPPQWTVGFESTGKFWMYVEFQIEQERIIGQHCDT